MSENCRAAKAISTGHETISQIDCHLLFLTASFFAIGSTRWPVTLILICSGRNTDLYLNFKVERDKIAKTKLIIQKRTITFGSAHPLSSKW